MAVGRTAPMNTYASLVTIEADESDLNRQEKA